MKKIKVGILFGGKSVEHEVSLWSAKSVVKAINRELFEPILIWVDKKGEWQIVNESTYPDQGKNIIPEQSQQIAIVPGKDTNQFIYTNSCTEIAHLDVLFPLLLGTFGEDGSVQGLLKILNLPYVGSDVLSSAICMDKAIAKQLMYASGINVARGTAFDITKRDQINYNNLITNYGNSLFIKPANLGSSIGVSKVTTEEAFKKAIDLVFEYDHKVIIEETISGREIEFSVLGNENPQISIPGEVLLTNELYTYESKYLDENDSKFAIPAVLSREKVMEMQQTALKAYEKLQCEGLARVDLFLTENGRIYVNELNTIPSFAKSSIYPKLWEASGISYSELITKLINLAIERHNRYKKLNRSFQLNK